MKKSISMLVFVFSVGFFFTSCNETQKKDIKNATQEVKKDVKKGAEKVGEVAKKAGEEVKEGAQAVGKEIKEDAQKAEKAVEKEVDKVKEDLAMNDYQCPMKCEGDKVYHEEGKCPKCGMKLKKIN